jgi:hypothetical protein
MTDPVLEELLASEGLSPDGLDDLVAWAKERAAELAAEAAHDEELGPLLSGSVSQGERRPVSNSDATTEPRAPVDASMLGAQSGYADRSAEDEDEIEGVDVAALVNEAVAGLLEDGPEADAPESPVRTGQTQPNPAVAAAVDPDAVLADVSTPPGQEATEAAAPHAEEEIEELDDVEMLDDDELEMLEEEEEVSTEGSQAAPPPAPPRQQAAAAEPSSQAPTYGPPDGNENVPEWKAALYSAEMGDDKAAAERIKEESYVGPMPQGLPDAEEPVASQRLVAEEDEISQHNIDLSDLDGA